MSISGRTKNTIACGEKDRHLEDNTHTKNHIHYRYFDAGLFKILFKDFLLESYQIKKKLEFFRDFFFSLS